ncbi:TPA: phage tail assembly chaperone [Bacillus thuringiensis]|nr:phage tail assembly chaperone [Bacillus thuringiensis]
MSQSQSQFRFDFEKTYKEIDVAGTVYKIAFDDDAMLKYQIASKEYEAKVQEVQTLVPDIEKASVEELKLLNEKQKALFKETIELFLGDDTFEELYEKAGRSVIQLTGLLDYLTGLVEEELKSQSASVQDKYLQNKKK